MLIQMRKDNQILGYLKYVSPADSLFSVSSQTNAEGSFLIVSALKLMFKKIKWEYKLNAIVI